MSLRPKRKRKKEKRTLKAIRCPWCMKNDTRLDDNYNCKKCGRVVLAHWSKVERRNEIERPLHSIQMCPRCAKEEGIVKVVKLGNQLVYEWVDEMPNLETRWGVR